MKPKIQEKKPKMPLLCKYLDEKNNRCRTQAIFHMPGETKYFCATHRKPEMITKNNHKGCKAEGCTVKQPTYGKSGTKTPIFCSKHAKEYCKKTGKIFQVDFINVKDKRCEGIDEKPCVKFAKFNPFGGSPTHCGEHSEEIGKRLGLEKDAIKNAKTWKTDKNMTIDKEIVIKERKEKEVSAKKGETFIEKKIPLKKLPLTIKVHKTGTSARKCIVKYCKKIPEYNHTEFSKGLYCEKHQIAGMVNVVYRSCQHLEKKCEYDALYNFPHKEYGIFCVKHRKEGMMIIGHKLCRFVYENGAMCSISPSYNYPGEKCVTHCKNHRKDGMIITYKKQCAEKDCNERAAYNFFDKETYLYCKIHKEKGMINLDHRNELCKHDGEQCLKRAKFNKPGEKKGIYCKKHKLKGMKYILFKTCLGETNGVKCKKTPTFNVKGEYRGIYCDDHKLEGMRNVKDKTCRYILEDGEQCETIPVYNYRGERKAEYCEKHKDKDMVNVKDRKCKSEFCDIIANKKYDYYCCHCFTNLFPDDPRTFTAMKASKELEVKKYLYENDYEFIHNKPIYTGDCITRRRIDLYNRIDEDHILCIEIDEKQHMYYDSIDEEERYNELYPLTKDGKNPVLIFIRYNPDSYIDVNGKRRNPRFKTRMKHLTGMIERIEHDIKYSNDYSIDKGLIHVHKMYYNE
jgi:hypothetical protein